MGCCTNSPSSNLTNERNQIQKKIDPLIENPPSTQASKQQLEIRGQNNTNDEMKKIMDDFFDKYDLNGDGVLNKYQLGHLINDFNCNIDSTQIVTKQEIRTIEQSVNKDDDHVVTREEFYSFFKRSNEANKIGVKIYPYIDNPPSTQASKKQERNKGQNQVKVEMKKILDDYFDKYDLNGDGVLNKYELGHLINDFNANMDQKQIVTKEEIRIIEQVVNRDDDHVVTREEFFSFFKKQ